ncbi:Uncharacterised protein [Vibrio cholerae]|nr:Uncharacterised protein [Vibrio cholerae]CSI72286.1 Uncharacterised protein [Vibrio cholerae]
MLAGNLPLKAYGQAEQILPFPLGCNGRCCR